ncbi:unnamed protein product [Amoebophrya sp. A25]|nr:unnamed protein product [Amoebophrya sp. A25]|eukprot:GSA25T00015675001.1
MRKRIEFQIARRLLLTIRALILDYFLLLVRQLL